MDDINNIIENKLIEKGIYKQAYEDGFCKGKNDCFKMFPEAVSKFVKEIQERKYKNIR